MGGFSSVELNTSQIISKVRAIAFYLPQFYPTPENDQWWEPGFTEWTNVTRTKPLFRGHYQPRLPRDLGFYDLRVSETREKQAQLAQYAGIEGFCYWHYWFAGRRLLDIPFREVVESGKPDYPFCLCWANHSWKAKTWNPLVPDKMLIEQTYPGDEDIRNHFFSMLPAFKDKRYMKVNGKLIFGIFNPIHFPIAESFMTTWNQLAKDNDLDGFWFFALAKKSNQLSMFDSSKYDAIVLDTVSDGYSSLINSRLIAYYRGLRYRLHLPNPVEYETYVQESLGIYRNNGSVIPCIDPDFDHSPRSGWKEVILHNSTPEKWELLCKETCNIVSNKPFEERLLFIKAWNEWGEGNYLEPDQRWGKGYIDATKKAFKKQE